jgi:arginyl-tRNA--protein-N-Asp/Glu arginylyltransferase
MVNCELVDYNYKMVMYDDSMPYRHDTLKSALEKYFIETAGPCPYGLAQTAIYRQALLGNFPEPVLEILFAAGYRRNGNSIYTMVCPGCKACVPLRIDPLAFSMNRSQKRVARKNRDLNIAIGPIRVSEEKLLLCNDFLQTRYPGINNSAEEYYSGFFLNTGGYSYEMEYRLGSKLLGVAVVDCGRNFINAVYFYFDSAAGHRSPGTFNVLYLIDFCRRKRIKYLYLGYWIKGVQAMSYKANFKPHYLLQDGDWVKVARETKPALTGKKSPPRGS